MKRKGSRSGGGGVAVHCLDIDKIDELVIAVQWLSPR